jgi:hypothetical protein
MRDVGEREQPEETEMKMTPLGLAAVLGVGLAVSSPVPAEAHGSGYYGYHYGHYHPYRKYKRHWVKRHYPYHLYGYYRHPHAYHYSW